MGDLGTNTAAPLGPHSTLEPSARSIRELLQLSPLPPALGQESQGPFNGWETIGGQRDFYDERDCLDPSYNLASEKLQDRGKDDVVIFCYPLDPDHLNHADGDPPAEGDCPSLGRFSADNDIFFRVPKNELIESEKFNQIINPAKEPRLIQSQGPWLAIIDFPQCYDTYDDGLLNLMGEKLGLQRKSETAFMDAYSQRVRALPGRGRFRTGISSRAPFKKLSESPMPRSSEDRFILFVSFPYFGAASEKITLCPKSESVKLLDFKRLGLGAPDCTTVLCKVERDYTREVPVEKGEVLVHQARYMIFDNHAMATFRSREDSAKDQIPLHNFQERIGTFHAMVQMIANRVDSELSTLGKLQASLFKLEEDTDRMISDAKTCEYNKGIAGIPNNGPLVLGPLSGIILAHENLNWDGYYERARDHLTSLNGLSAALFAAASVAERQIAVLQNLHTIFLTSYRTKTSDYEKGYPLRRNPFYKNIIPISILSECPQQIWPNTLEIINEVIRERECLIRKIKGLVENMEIRRKILLGFLKSDNEATAVMKRTEDTMRETRAILMQQVQQTQTLSVFTVVTTAFLPLSFCASYFGMNNIKEFNEHPISRNDFWQITGPLCAGIILLAVIVIFWERPIAARFRDYVRRILGLSPKEK